jgi:thermostable 8-oxoguanine DNA glycosylase
VPLPDEIEVADFIDERFKGFGPKQARNFLQALGLTRYEIPIDSRMTKWLNKNGFPVKLSATALADKNYYRFVSDGIQALCEKAEVLPYLLDAAVFTLSDSNQFTEEQLSWI